MNIRSADQSDLSALAKSLAPEPSRVQLTNRFAEQRAGLRLMFVMEVEGELVGTISLDPKTDEDGFTRRLFAVDVAERFRRRGFATQLIREVEKQVLADGHSAIRLDVAIDNFAAIALYEKLGYERIGQPTRLSWSRQIDGHPSEIVADTSQRMVKRIG